MSELPPGIRRALRLRRDLKDQVTGEVEAEMRFHLESRTEELVAQGMDRQEAERRALEEFGDVERAKRALVHESARTERRVRLSDWLRDLRQDLVYGSRVLISRPVFAAVAILTLALGIGANTAIFSLVQAVLLRPLPYLEPERLVLLWETRPDGDDHNVVSRGNFMDWREMAESFEQLGGFSSAYGVGLSVSAGAATRVSGASATPGVFRALGTSPLLGRTFTTEEGIPGNADVALISHRLWQQRFGGDPEIVGSSAIFDDEPYLVVGVMPPGFDFPSPTVDAWFPWPLGEDDRQNRRSHNLRVIGRLKPDVTVERAQSEMDALAARITEAHPQYMTDWGVSVLPFRADLVREVRPLLILLLGVVLVVLLIACANLANLLLARATARQREVAVRAALGAGRFRLVRQFLTEAALIAFIGAGLGFAVTAWGLDLFVALAPSDIPLLDNTRVDLAVLGFALAATFLATALFGLVPAFRITSVDPQATLRTGGGRSVGATHARLRAGLLVAEVALSVLLLIGAGLLLRTFQNLQRVDYGFDPQGLLATTVALPSARYSDTPQQVAFLETLTERVTAIPGVESAAGTSDAPGGGGGMTFSFAIENRPSPNASGREDPVPLRVVTPDFFRTLRIPSLNGRVLDERDGPGAPPVLVINESLARRHWPDSDPVGVRVSFQREDQPEWWEIVGVVRDTRLYAADEPGSPAIYMTYAQKRWGWMNWMTVVARTRGRPQELAGALRNAIQAADPALPVGRIETVPNLYREGESRRRFAAVLLGGFAGLALLLGVIGIYGVLSYSVSQSTREIGVRIALGAPRGKVAGAVVRRGLGLALAGVALGLVAALGLSRFLASLLYGVTTTDTLTFLAVPSILIAVAAAAAYFPARRATRIDPVEALRES